MPAAAQLVAAHIDPEIAGSLVALGLSIVIVIVVWVVRGSHGGKQTRGTIPRPGAPSCPCGYLAKWTVPNGPWHCDRCNLPVVQAMPQAHAAPGPSCPTCGSAGRWLGDAVGGWGCDRCRQMIQPRA